MPISDANQNSNTKCIEPTRTPLIRTPKESEKLFQLTGLVLDFVCYVRVRPAPNMIFCMCNIWAIRRRNVIYLYKKNSILINFFTVKVSGYDVIR